MSYLVMMMCLFVDISLGAHPLPSEDESRLLALLTNMRRDPAASVVAGDEEEEDEEQHGEDFEMVDHYEE